MKKLTKWMAIIGIIVMMNFNSYSQVSVLGNAGAVGNYVGWNAAQLFPVTVAHKGNFPILFETNGINRMTIFGGTGGATAGRIAIGNSIPGTFVPLARLHLLQFGAGNNGLMLRSDGDIAVNNMWQLHTGVTINSVIEKFRLTALANSNHVTLQTIQNGYMAMHTNQKTKNLY